MTEFDITQWTDFVRGVADPETEAEMQQQLASNPSQSPAAALLRLAEVARRDGEDPVPDHAVRVAKAIGSLHRPSSPAALRDSILQRLPFTVVADTLLHGAAAGARDLQSPYRHIVFEAEGYSIDVRLEREAEPAGTVVLGQLLHHGEEVGPVREVPVLMLADERIVGRTTTGEFGEFQAEGLPGEPLDLCLLVGSEQCLQLPLEPEAG